MTDDDDGSPPRTEKPGTKKQSFEARLHAARQRQGLEPSAPDAAKGSGGDLSPSALAVGMRVGVELVSALAVAAAIGWELDRWLHTRPVLLAVFVLLGGAAGVANVWRLVGPGQQPGGK